MAGHHSSLGLYNWQHVILGTIQLHRYRWDREEGDTRMAEPQLDQEMIVRAVRDWSRERREELARLILMDTGQNTIDPKTGRPFVSSEDLYGLFATPSQPAPTDEDIERLLMERHDA